MKILVVGSGAREHTIVWKLAQSPRATAIFAAPGNAGTAEIATNLPVDAGDIEAMAAAVKDNRIDFVVIGPEAPLAAGIVDRFQALGIPVFGPSQRAAEIESSKVFAKDFMAANGIPCPGSVAFSDRAAAADHIRRQLPPIVVKAD
ncbi:MAG: phosphoribosylamine--glycine ligase, partial [Dehalococcoidales bacterium]